MQLPPNETTLTSTAASAQAQGGAVAAPADIHFRATDSDPDTKLN
jgi:hypothetical protein